MGFEQTFLYISAERSIKAGICQLILMMFIFGCDLFQSIDSLVIGIGCGSVLFIESHDPFRFGLYLTVFSFTSTPLSVTLNSATADVDTLDLSAVAEFKVTDKGVEVKLVDRVRALETLCGLLESGGSGGAEELYRALEDAAGQMEGGWGDD